MTINDLKVQNARVFVSNEEAEVKDYVIGANFNTNNGKLERVTDGNVTKDDVTYASFSTGYGNDKSTTITYYNEANKKHELQCEVNKLINDFMTLAVAKVAQEAAE
jgi:hypothetical protein